MGTTTTRGDRPPRGSIPNTHGDDNWGRDVGRSFMTRVKSFKKRIICTCACIHISSCFKYSSKFVFLNLQWNESGFHIWEVKKVYGTNVHQGGVE